MAITTAQLYITADGKEFKNELDALGHDMTLKISTIVEGYIAKAGINPEKAQAGLLRKNIPAFIGYMSQFGATAEEAAAKFSEQGGVVAEASEEGAAE